MKQGDLFGPAEPPRPEVSPTQAPAPQVATKPRAEVAPPKAMPAPPPRPPAPAPAAPSEGEARVPAWRAPRPAPQVLSVSALTARIKGVLLPAFGRVLVRGEVSGFRGANARGHLYFSLKDSGASIEVRLWQTLARTLPFALKDGLSVIVEGALDVYEPQGRYSLIVERIEPEGVGARALALEQLKQRLAAQGLLGPNRRPPRPLPFLPRRVGVVTSVSGAALKDFLKVLHRRHPRLSVLVADTRVQGDGAAFEVRRAIRALGEQDVDLIVVTRGGGSVDDLWTFNEEAVVRAIFESPVPVVSAVGHEIDVTLADLVADVRAPTPSAAAEAVAPVLVELEAQLATARARLQRGWAKQALAQRSQLQVLRGRLGDPRRRLSQQRLWLDDRADRLVELLRRRTREGVTTLRALTGRLQGARPQAQLKRRGDELGGLEARLLASPARLVARWRGELTRLALGLERRSPRPALPRARAELEAEAQRLTRAIRAQAAGDRATLAGLAARLDLLSPLKVLGRGYAIVQVEGGRVVRRAEEVAVGQGLSVRLAEGVVEATVSGVKPGQK